MRIFVMNKLKTCYKKVLIWLRRRKLKNFGFTVISNNCCGGIIYNSLGERFLSPTINLFIRVDDYFCFLENLQECLSAEIEQVFESGTKWPIGQMVLQNNRKIRIHFVHYKDFEDARNKWYERRRRVNLDNLFVFMEAGVETTDEIVERFEGLPYKNKVIITNKHYKQCPHTFFMDIYEVNYKPGKIISYLPFSLYSKRYLDKFDYIKWLNDGNIEECKLYGGKEVGKSEKNITENI